MPETSKLTITRAVTWSTLAAAITAYTHFFGYSYLRAKLSSAGFEGVPVDIHLQESLYQAIEALFYFLRELWRGNFTEKLVQEGALFSAICALIMVSMWAWPRLSPTFHNVIAKMRPHEVEGFWRGALEVVSLASMGGIMGFLLPFIAAIVIVGALAVIWLAMGLGSVIGYGHSAELLREGVCKPIDWETQNTAVVRGCIQIQLADGPLVSGTVLYRNAEYTYLVTNDSALEIDREGKVRTRVAFNKKPAFESTGEGQ